MRVRRLFRSCAAAIVFAAACLAMAPAFGLAQTQTSTPTSPAKKWTAPRTANGQPDLQGVWSFATITPLERPAELAGKAVLTPEEAAAWEKQVIARENKDSRSDNKLSDVSAAYNDFWWDRGTNVVGTRRTSLIIDPPDGRLPPMTPEAQKRAAARAAIRSRSAQGPEDRPAAERCIIGFNAGPPMIPSAYNNNVQLFQTGDHVAIFNEMIHEARIVPLDQRAHVNRGIGLWRGDSRGHWEGDTLVVDTTNFNDQARVSYDTTASATLHVVEKFTRVDANTLLYEFTVTDPATWTKPWSGQLPMVKTSDKIYEYACHEGNYAMEHMLSGARSDEKAGERAPGKK
jgi:hypothetical protein